MRTDPGLPRQVYIEDYRGFEVRAFLTRFGGLSAFVYLNDGEAGWQGDNILEAREWVDEFHLAHDEEFAA